MCVCSYMCMHIYIICIHMCYIYIYVCIYAYASMICVVLYVCGHARKVDEMIHPQQKSAE